eukprot:1302305-Prymnesium_polylepis.1
MPRVLRCPGGVRETAWRARVGVRAPRMPRALRCPGGGSASVCYSALCVARALGGPGRCVLQRAVWYGALCHCVSHGLCSGLCAPLTEVGGGDRSDGRHQVRSEVVQAGDGLVGVGPISALPPG